MAASLYPESRLKTPKRSIRGAFGINWVPMFCANCGKEGGLVPEDAINCSFSHYECMDCAAKLGNLDGFFKVPDEVVGMKVREAQLEHEGRELTREEVAVALSSDTHYLSKIKQDYDNIVLKGRGKL